MSLISFLLVAFFCIYELTHGSLLLLIVTVHGLRGIENLSLLVSTKQPAKVKLLYFSFTAHPSQCLSVRGRGLILRIRAFSPPAL